MSAQEIGEATCTPGGSEVSAKYTTCEAVVLYFSS
jgi:hypothetical protein